MLLKRCVWGLFRGYVWRQIRPGGCSGRAPLFQRRAEASHRCRGFRSRCQRVGGGALSQHQAEPVVSLEARSLRGVDAASLTAFAGPIASCGVVALHAAGRSTNARSSQLSAGHVRDRDGARPHITGALLRRRGQHPALCERARQHVMIPVPTNPARSGAVRVWLATGHTDMRRGFPSLALLVQETLKADPYAGDLFVFRGRRGDLIKVIWHDGQGACLFSKRLERGRFIWPTPVDGAVAISPAQLGYLLEGIDWRAPQATYRPQIAG